MNHFCLPNATDYANADTLNQIKNALMNNTVGDTVGEWVFSIAKAWPVICVSIPVAVIIGYLYLFIIRAIGGFIIWLSFAVIVLSLAAVGLYAWFYLQFEYPEGDPFRSYMQYVAYVFWGLSGLVLCSLCCCYSAVRLGIAVFKTTAQYIQANMHIFFLPALANITAAIWFLLWAGSFLFLYSVGDPRPRDPPLNFVTSLTWTDLTKGAVAYHIFGLFWINAFILGVNQFVISASACLWYFEVSTDTKGKGTVNRAYWIAFRYHLGSVAFGSFLIAVC